MILVHIIKNIIISLSLKRFECRQFQSIEQRSMISGSGRPTDNGHSTEWHGEWTASDWFVCLTTTESNCVSSPTASNDGNEMTHSWTRLWRWSWTHWSKSRPHLSQFHSSLFHWRIGAATFDFLPFPILVFCNRELRRTGIAAFRFLPAFLLAIFVELFPRSQWNYQAIFQLKTNRMKFVKRSNLSWDMNSHKSIVCVALCSFYKVRHILLLSHILSLVYGELKKALFRFGMIVQTIVSVGNVFCLFHSDIRCAKLTFCWLINKLFT